MENELVSSAFSHMVKYAETKPGEPAPVQSKARKNIFDVVR